MTSDDKQTHDIGKDKRVIALLLGLAIAAAVMVLIVLSSVPRLDPVSREVTEYNLRESYCGNLCEVRHAKDWKAQMACKKECPKSDETLQLMGQQQDVCRPSCPQADPSAPNYMTSQDECMLGCVEKGLAQAAAKPAAPAAPAQP